MATNLGITLSDGSDLDVVVVDNWSSDTERALIREHASDRGWTLIAMDANVGFGAGVNAGAAVAIERGATDILILNPDAHIDAQSISRLAAAVEEDRLTIASPVVKDVSGRVWFGGLDLYLADGTIRAPRRRSEHPGAEHVEWLSGACLWVTKEAWEVVGGFDDAYFLYWEDVDFSRRAAAHGVRLAVVADAVAVHDEGGTQREAGRRPEAKSEAYYYYNIRNRMLFAARHLDAEGVRRWMGSSSVRNAWEILLRGGRRQFLRPVAPVRAAWKGVRDGRRIARAALSQTER
ncbi:glycosyltransferase family 2 protein [uncultured Microbacterium sp.]|uniref:glycosyltransferase family 2 protein n=1 Tax=uncultured Microbacterium sp. TaxID=191216 RepID=UPI0037DBFC2B